MSRKKLAELAGVDPTYVGLLEKGRRDPSLVVMGKLANGLRIDLAELVADLGHRAP